MSDFDRDIRQSLKETIIHFHKRKSMLSDFSLCDEALKVAVGYLVHKMETSEIL